MAAVWLWADRKRWACRGGLNRPIIFSRRRVGRGDASARLFSPLWGLLRLGA